jgi:hypothetical protein
MSEFQPISPFWLSFAGLLISFIAIAFTGLTYRRQQPRLKVEILRCDHLYASTATSPDKFLKIWTSFRVSNTGDRPTKLKSISLKVTLEGKTRNLNTAIAELGEGTGSYNPEPDRWIQAHDFIKFVTLSTDTVFINPTQELNCVFTLSHTHSSIRITATSRMAREPPNYFRDFLEKFP